MLLVDISVICHNGFTPSSGTASYAVPPSSLQILGEITPAAARLPACRPQLGDEAPVLTTLTRDVIAVSIRKVEIAMAAFGPFHSGCLSGELARSTHQYAKPGPPGPAVSAMRIPFCLYMELDVMP